MVHCEPSDCSSFRYVDPHTGEVVTSKDYDGCLRLFNIRGGKDAIWHAVVSEGHRWSLGVLLSDRGASKLASMTVSTSRRL